MGFHPGRASQDRGRGFAPRRRSDAGGGGGGGLPAKPGRAGDFRVLRAAGGFEIGVHQGVRARGGERRRGCGLSAYSSPEPAEAGRGGPIGGSRFPSRSDCSSRRCCRSCCSTNRRCCRTRVTCRPGIARPLSALDVGHAHPAADEPAARAPRRRPARGRLEHRPGRGVLQPPAYPDLPQPHHHRPSGPSLHSAWLPHR